MGLYFSRKIIKGDTDWKSLIKGEKLVTRKRCALCMSENRQNLEQQLEENVISCDEMDEANGWKSGTAAQHQRNHMGDFEMSSNPKCVLCIDPMKAI